jgi:hypothetical protein
MCTSITIRAKMEGTICRKFCGMVCMGSNVKENAFKTEIHLMPCVFLTKLRMITDAPSNMRSFATGAQIQLKHDQQNRSNTDYGLLFSLAF